jgi:hypothetical protein
LSSTAGTIFQMGKQSITITRQNVEGLDLAVHMNILSFCNAKILIQFLRVSKYWRKIASTPEFWKLLLSLDFPQQFDHNEILRDEREIELKEMDHVQEYLAKAKVIRIIRKRFHEGRKRELWYIKNEKAFIAGKVILSNAHGLLLILPLFIFTVLLAVKMDRPGSFNWVTTFVPFYIFDFLISVPTITYWIFYLRCPETFRTFLTRGNFEPFYHRWNLLFTSFHLVVDAEHRLALIWRIFNTLCLSLWIAFTVILPIGLGQGSESLIYASFVLMILSGVYGMFIVRLTWRTILNPQDYNETELLGFMTSVLSMAPTMFLSAILWFLQWKFNVIGSYTNALIPFFISNAIMLFSPLSITILLKILPPWRPANQDQPRPLNFENGMLLFVATLFIVVPLIIFEVLLLLHMEQSRFSFTVVFIPLWILLGITGILGWAIFIPYIKTKMYIFKILPNAYFDLPDGHKMPIPCLEDW